MKKKEWFPARDRNNVKAIEGKRKGDRERGHIVARA